MCECGLHAETPGRRRGGHRRRARHRQGAGRAGWSPRARGSWSTTSTRTPAARWPRSSARRPRPATAPPTPACARSSTTATEALGRIDVYLANAGIDRTQPDSLQASDEDWARMIDTNVMAHVRAARRAGAAWLADGEGRPVRGHRVGRRAAHDDRRRAVLGDQARRGRLRGVALGDLRPPRHRRPGDLPAGRADPDARAGRAAQGPAHPRRRPHPRRRWPTRGWPRWPRTGSWCSRTPRSAATTPPAPRTPTRWLAGMRRLQAQGRRADGDGHERGARSEDVPGLDLGGLPALVRRQRPGEIAGELRGAADRRRQVQPHLRGHRRRRRGGSCAAHRWATCRRRRTTWAASTPRCPRWPTPTYPVPRTYAHCADDSTCSARRST